MTQRDPGFFSALLIASGAGWGLTQPLSKIAVSTGHGHFGLIFWQLVIGALALMLAGVFLVRPRPGAVLAPNREDGQDMMQRKQREIR